MAVINDDKFMRQTLDSQDASNVFNQKGYNRSDLTGIGDRDRWEAMKMVSDMIPTSHVAADDAFPEGTLVEFVAPDGTEYRGRVASKSGSSDYLVEVSQGESYLVPLGKLSKVTPESDQIKEAMRRHTAPTIELVAKPAIEVANRCVARVAYRERRPTDDDLIRWASDHYPDWRLVDAVDGDNREIGLIFEILAMEDDKPQGGDQVNRGRPLSSELVEGTGVTAGDIVSFDDIDACEDQIPGGLADDADADDFDPEALDEGISVELEHTDDHDIAREIAMDHLTEDPKYYKKLKKVESSIVTFDDVPNTMSLDDVVKTSAVGICDMCGKQADLVATSHQGRPADLCDECMTSLGDMTRGAQLGEPGSEEDYRDLVRAARWVLARFNDSNPDFYAVPQESEEAGTAESRVVRLSFLLEAKDDDDNLSHLYLSRSGKLVTESDKQPGMDPVRGFVQVDSEGNMPMIMLHTPIGPENVQEYGFDFMAEREIAKLADYDACRAEADACLAEFGGYSAEAQAAFEARLVKLGIDEKAKDYWKGYFGEYGKMLTRNVPKKKHKAHRKVAVDEHAKQYWINYFGIVGAGWYGEALTRDIPRRIVNDSSPSPQEAAPKKNSPSKSSPPKSENEESEEMEDEEDESNDFEKKASDYEGYIKEVNGKYEVKSEKNPDWSGGTYDTKEAAEKRLKQVEMFKHMGSYDPELRRVVGTVLDGLMHKSAQDIEAAFGKGQPWRRTKQTAPSSNIPLRDLYEVATWSIEIAKEDEQMYNAVYSLALDYLRKNPAFLRSELGGKLDEYGLGYTLTYALAKSPRAFRKFQKAINKYTRKREKGEWGKLRQTTEDWRKDQKGKGKPKKERGEGPTDIGEQLADDIEEELEVELEGSDLEPVEDQPEAPKKTKQQSDEEFKPVIKVIQKLVNSINNFYQVDAQYAKGEADLPTAIGALNSMTKLMEENKDTFYEEIVSKNKGIEKMVLDKVKFYQGELKKLESQQKQAPAKATPPKPPEEELVVEPEQQEQQQEQPKKKKPFDMRKIQPKQEDQGDWMNPQPTSTLSEGYQMEYTSMRQRQADKAPGPVTHNAPGKDDRKDYDHKEPREQPSKARTRFKVSRMYSTTASADNGYIFMELAWEPKDFESMSDQNIQQQIISFVKGMESNKEFHDFGIMGRVRIVEFDKDAGVARIKVRCSETRGVPTLGYAGDLDDPISVSGIR